METMLVWWTLSWGPMHSPVYERRMPSQRACMYLIRDLVEESGRELLGHYDAPTHTCRISIFPGRVQ
jgi:hypothetical protein